MQSSLLLGVVALLNLPVNGAVPGAASGVFGEEEFLRPSATLAAADWPDTTLTASSRTTQGRAEDMRIPTFGSAQEEDSPVISSVSEADPSTEIVWDGEGAPPSEGFLEAPAIPIAAWADTKLTRPAPPAPPRPATTSRSGSTTSRSAGGSAPARRVVPDSPLLTYHDEKPGHKFPWGQCTYYVSTQRRITFRGNAKEWLTNAKRAGYRVGDVPIVGSVVVTTESWYGHVGYVEWVSADQREFRFSEMNYVGLGVVSRRTMSVSDRRVRGFIY